MTGGVFIVKERVYSKDVILVLAASFFYFACPMLVTPLITGFSGSIGASAGLMGIIGGLMNLCSLFCRPLVGNLADRISKYKVSFWGAGLMALSCIGYIVAWNPLLVVISRIVNGIGFACCSVCMSTWMSNMLPREKIGSGMGFYGMMNALGMAIGPAIGVSVYQLFGYRAAFFIALVLALGTIVIIQFISDKGEPVPADTGSSQTASSDIKTGNVQKGRIQIVDKKVIPIAVIIMLFTIPYCATQSFLVNYTEARHLPVSVSLFFPLYAVVLLVLRFSMKSLFDKLPFWMFLSGSAASALLSIFCLTFMDNNIWLFFAALFMAGGYGIMCSVCQSTAILLAGPEKRGLANSTYYVGLDLGMTLGPMIGGFLYGNVSLGLFYPTLLLIVPAVLLVWTAAHKKITASSSS